MGEGTDSEVLLGPVGLQYKAEMSTNLTKRKELPENGHSAPIGRIDGKQRK